MDEVKQLFSGQAEQTQDPEQVPLASKAIWSLYPWRNKIGPFISSALCALHCRCLVPFARVEIWTWLLQQADPNPQRQRPLPVCCLYRFAPCSVFSVRGETFSITEWRTWMVALLVGLHVGSVRSVSPNAQNPRLPLSIALLPCCCHVFSQYNRCVNINIYFYLFSTHLWLFVSRVLITGSKKYRAVLVELWSRWGRLRAWVRPRSRGSTKDAQCCRRDQLYMMKERRESLFSSFIFQLQHILFQQAPIWFHAAHTDI